LTLLPADVRIAGSTEVPQMTFPRLFVHAPLLLLFGGAICVKRFNGRTAWHRSLAISSPRRLRRWRSSSSSIRACWLRNAADCSCRRRR